MEDVHCTEQMDCHSLVKARLDKDDKSFHRNEEDECSLASTTLSDDEEGEDDDCSFASTTISSDDDDDDDALEHAREITDAGVLRTLDLRPFYDMVIRIASTSRVACKEICTTIGILT